MVLCGLSYGGKIVVYDGSPFQPDPLVTLRLVEKLKYVVLPPIHLIISVSSSSHMFLYLNNN